jgi:hypothetical protein
LVTLYTLPMTPSSQMPGPGPEKVKSQSPVAQGPHTVTAWSGPLGWSQDGACPVFQGDYSTNLSTARHHNDIKQIKLRLQDNIDQHLCSQSTGEQKQSKLQNKT